MCNWNQLLLTINISVKSFTHPDSRNDLFLSISEGVFAQLTGGNTGISNSNPTLTGGKALRHLKALEFLCCTFMEIAISTFKPPTTKVAEKLVSSTLHSTKQMVEYTWQPEDRDGGLRWQSQRQRSKSRLRSRGQGDRPHPQHQPEENSQIWGLRWVKSLHIACFEQFLVFYQDEGVDTSLLAAEAGCACSESWKGGNEISLKSFLCIFWE